jgi:hypothetical protein
MDQVIQYKRVHPFICPLNGDRAGRPWNMPQWQKHRLGGCDACEIISGPGSGFLADLITSSVKDSKTVKVEISPLCHRRGGCEV